jgi:hypothetical protein
VAKQPELSRLIFTTHPCNLPLGSIAFKLTPKNKQTFPIYQVLFEGPTDLSIHLVLEWPDFDIVSFKNTFGGKDKPESSLVCRLHLQSMIDEKNDNIYRKPEAVTLKHTLNRIEELYRDFLAKTYPTSTIEMKHFMSDRGVHVHPTRPLSTWSRCYCCNQNRGAEKPLFSSGDSPQTHADSHWFWLGTPRRE